MRATWIGKKAEFGGGDEIYDRLIKRELGLHLEIHPFDVRQQGKRDSLVNLVTGTPHPRFKYLSRDTLHRAKTAEQTTDVTIVSLEALEGYVRSPDRPTVLIVHNVISDALRQIFPHNPVATLAAAHSNAWEKSLYRRKNLALVCLSKRDRATIARIAPLAKVFMAPPGAPPPSPLSAKAYFRPEVIISGTYGWWPKRRDAIHFARQYSSSSIGLPVFRDELLPPEAEALLTPSPVAANSFSDGIRLGLIPDNFSAGFKLKATYYIANNCVCITMADLVNEFSDIPDHDIFVRRITSPEDILEIANQFQAFPPDELVARFSAFKDRCLSLFSWRSSAQIVHEAAKWVSQH